MSGQHTSGPWFVVPYGDGDTYVVCTDTKGNHRVCFLATPSTGETWHKSFANARLIAAAPELLEALSSFLAEADAGHVTVETDRQARAAISKAKGEF